MELANILELLCSVKNWCPTGICCVLRELGHWSHLQGHLSWGCLLSSRYAIGWDFIIPLQDVLQILVVLGIYGLRWTHNLSLTGMSHSIMTSYHSLLMADTQIHYTIVQYFGSQDRRCTSWMSTTAWAEATLKSCDWAYRINITRATVFYVYNILGDWE